jgi:hypothetical protein
MRMATLAMLYGVDGRTAMPTHNAALMLQNDSNIYDGWADFKTATVFTVHAAFHLKFHVDSLPLFVLMHFGFAVLSPG